MKFPFLFFAFLIGIASPLSFANATDWASYSNQEFGFSVEYPLGIFDSERTSESGIGITLETADKSVEFRAYGFNNNDKLSLKKVQEILLEDADGRDVTYKRIKDNWVVLSGYEQEAGRRMIFYQRLETNSDLTKFSAFEFIYPASERATYDGFIKRMGASLTSPAR